MERNEALKLLKENLKHRNLIKHSLAVEACMRALAQEMGEDPDRWGLAGLLHDIDYELTMDRPEEHGLKAMEILKDKIKDEEILHAIRAHAYKEEPKTKMAWALYSADPLTGLIVAAALMHPTKRLEGVDLGFLKRRFKEKRFAAGADREQIKKCENLGLDLDRFMELCLNAMKGISGELGL